MTDRTDTTERQPRDAANWAPSRENVRVSNVPVGATNLNVDGRQVMGPLQGFGPMWQKTYRIVLSGSEVAPEEVIRVWKSNFPAFWPPKNRFYAPLSGITPGEVALINASGPGGMPLSTGVMVLYSDDQSFTLMTTQGHPFSGWVTFSSYREEGVTVVQAQVLMRANDPMWELGMRFGGGHRAEDKIWQHTLSSLADYLQATGEVTTEYVCVDRKIQWRRAGNIWHNAGMRSTLYMLASPALRLRTAIRGSRS